MADTPEIVTTEGQRVRPFGELLAEFRRGELHREVSLALHELLDAVIATEKAGDLTLKVKVAPHGDMQVSITPRVALKKPEPAAPMAAYYVDRHGNPTRRDPLQESMFPTLEED